LNFFDLLHKHRRGILALTIVYLVLVTVLLLALNYSVVRYQTNIENQKAYLLLTQVQSAVLAEKVNIANPDSTQKKTLRAALKKFVDPSSAIQVLLIFNKQKQVVVASEPLYERMTVSFEEETHFDISGPTVINDSLDAERGVRVLDVMLPIEDNESRRGYLQGQVWEVQSTWYDRFRPVLFSLISALLGLIILIPVISWHWLENVSAPTTERRDQPRKPNPGNSATTDEHPPDEVDTVFSNLNKLYNEKEELNKSFQESEEQINSMMRVLNQGLLILDLNMTIITHNEYLIDVLQIRSTSNAHRRIYDLLQKNPRLLEMYRRAKQPLTHEVKQSFTLKLLNDRTISTEVMVRPFQSGEDIYGIAFYIKNIDVLNELEGTLQRSMKYGVISQLASSIGHEIRNPLSSLAIHTEIVDNMVEKSVSDEKRLSKIQKSIGILHSEVERLQKLIDQFFNLAKAQEIVLTYENINELIRGILDLVQQQAFEKNVEIKIFFSKDLPMVRVSKDQLKQVLINLILNGFDAMPDGGQLAIRTHFDEGKVFVDIKDSGHGIPENVRDNIFDLYFTTKESGGGIGLAISRKIIEAHEGKLYFETKTGVGTIFHIQLPTS